MTDSDKFVEMYSDKDSEKKLSFEEKLKMLNDCKTDNLIIYTKTNTCRDWFWHYC